jgi:anthranilate synthase component 1
MEPFSFEEVRALLDEGFNTVALVQTLQLDRETPVSLYQRFMASSAFFLLESAALGEDSGRYSFIGLDRQWRLTVTPDRECLEGRSATGVDPMTQLRERLRPYRLYQPPTLPTFLGGAVGFVSYDYVRRLEHLPKDLGPSPWPDVDFSFPGAMLICDHVRHTTTAVVLAAFIDDVDPLTHYRERRDFLDEVVATLLAPAPSSDEAVERLVAFAPSRRSAIDIRARAASYSNATLATYSAAVDVAKEHIVAGDIFQMVPSQQFRRPFNAAPLTLYRVLRALNPSPYMYLLDNGDSHIVGASPEMLLKVNAGVVTTRPIAGTRPRGGTDEADLAIEAELMADEKEIAEHVMLVDLGRNDVGRVAEPGSVDVERLAHVERFSHLMHIVSQVRGTLRSGVDAFDAFRALFPAGTLTGAPKVRAMSLIDDAETAARGPYGGAIGYFALNGDADFAITIRTVALRDGVATVQAGGGVVADSTGASEFNECISKASAPLLAVELVEPIEG